MKPFIVVVLCLTILLPVGVCMAQDTPVLETEKERINYSVGYQIGGDFMRQGVEIDPQILVLGIQDALAEEKPLLTQEEMRTTLVDLKKKIIAYQQGQQKAEAAENLAEGQAFLSKNGKKDGVTTTPSGLQYRVIQKGSGTLPQPTDTVTVHYRGTLLDGTEFDSSYRRNEPATFLADHVIPGWKEALQLMKPGSRYELFIPGNLAYGKRGNGTIGPNSTLIFEVELLSVQPKKK